ncbi:MAG: DUF502 domain-containing protein [Gammaproteobacteria bacterium]
MVQANVKKNIFIGLVTIIPLWLTLMIIQFLLQLILEIARPLLHVIISQISLFAPRVAHWMDAPVVDMFVALGLMGLILYTLGVLSSRYFGRQLLALIDYVMERIPLVKTIYGSIKKLIEVFQKSPGTTQRVVLIEFPNPTMKTVGLVTRTFIDKNSGRELAAVYVPTTPNPTSGYLEIVPIEQITPTDWTFDEAMTFIVSGGAVAPHDITYDKVEVIK